MRIRVNNLYGGTGETFRLEFIEIDYQVVLSGTDLSLTQNVRLRYLWVKAKRKAGVSSTRPMVRTLSSMRS